MREYACPPGGPTVERLFADVVYGRVHRVDSEARRRAAAARRRPEAALEPVKRPETQARVTWSRGACSGSLMALFHCALLRVLTLAVARDVRNGFCYNFFTVAGSKIEADMCAPFDTHVKTVFRVVCDGQDLK